MSEPRDDFERRFAQRYVDYLEEGVRGTDRRRLTAWLDEGASRPTRWWRAAMVGAATIGAAVVITMVTVQLLPSGPPPGTASGSPHASATPGATGEQTPSPAPSVLPTPHPTADWPTATPVGAVVPAQLELPGVGFWTLETSIIVRDWTLRIGTLEGRVTRTIALTPAVGPLDVTTIPVPVGPAGGRVLYVTDDGRTASLHVVEAATGDDRELTTTDAIIPRLAIDPAGSSAYFVALDRRSGAFDGLFRIEVRGGQPVMLIDPQPAAAMATLAAQSSYFPQIVVSNDGAWVVFASCRPAGCDVYAVTPDQSTLRGLTGDLLFGETIVGVAGDLLIGASSCAEATCDGFAVDLQSGERWPLGGPDAPFDPKRLIAGPRGPLVLGQGDAGAQGTWQLEALDLTDRSRTAAFAATYEPGYTVVGLAGEWPGAELPAGWFLIYRNADAAPAPYPDYSAARLGGTTETPLPIMTFPQD
jgi:hypothetical protein